MAISFPRDFPLDGNFTGNCIFDPVHQQSMSITGGAIPNVAELGPTTWRGEWSTLVLNRENFGIWTAWIQSLRGGLRTFKGRPALWKWPQTYPRGFAGLMVGMSAWDGFGNLKTIAELRDVITIDDVPNGFTLKAGDYLSIPVGSRQHLHRVTEGSVAASNELTVTIEPTIRPNAVEDIAVRFEAPYCEMVLMGQPSISRQGTRGGSISFSGQQVLI